MKAEAWLKKAQANTKKNKRLAHVHGGSASDGYRMHFDPDVSDKCDCDNYPDVAGLLDRARRNADRCRFITKTAHMMAVCDVMLAFCYSEASWSNPASREIAPMRFSINGSLSASVKTEVGESKFEAKDGDFWGFYYKTRARERLLVEDRFSLVHEGTDGSSAVNPKYLKDALSGMGEDVSVSLWDSMIYVTDGTREAVIMAYRMKK